MLAFLECHDASKYRKKIKGFHMAFNIREKDDSGAPGAMISHRSTLQKPKQSIEIVKK